MRGRRGPGRWAGASVGLALGLAALPGVAAAEEKADRETEAVSPPSAGAVTRITRAEIERRQWRTLADVLRAQPGIHLSQLGGRGQDALVLVRGNPSGAVLIRMDGIDLSDPGTQPAAALSDPEARSAGQIVPDLLTENIERIDILRGPQSARFGSDAIGGVIEIETRRGQGAASPWAAFEVGGFGTTQQSVGIGGGNETAGYSLSYSSFRTRGINSGPDDGFHERDGNENDTLSGRLDLALGDAVSIRATGRWIDEESQLDRVLDAALGIGLDLTPEEIAEAADRRPFAGERDRLYLGTETRIALFDERWVQTLGVRMSDHDVQQDDQLAESLTQTMPSGIFRVDITQTARLFQQTERDGQRLTLDWNNELRVTPQHTLIFGLETESESVERVLLSQQEVEATLVATPVGFPGFTPITQSFAFQQLARQRESERLRNQAAFVGDVFRYERMYGEVALRLHDHDDYGSGLTYRAALGYLDPDSRLRVFASVATGFRDPDILPSAASALLLVESQQSSEGDDLTMSDVFIAPGNRTLERAVSRGFELGFELPLRDDQLIVGATAFASRVRGLQSTELSRVVIDEVGRVVQTEPFADSAQARTRGVELAAAWQANGWLRARADYTYTHSELAHVPAVPASPFIIDNGEPIDQVRLVPPSGTDLTAVPKHRVNLVVEAEPLDGVAFSFALRHVGQRKDNLFTRSETRGGYTVYDLTAAYSVSERIELLARVENLFDKDYTDLRLSEQPGIAGYVGVRARY